MNIPAAAIALLSSLVLSSTLALAAAGPLGHAKCSDKGEACDRSVVEGNPPGGQSIYTLSATKQNRGMNRVQAGLIKRSGLNDTTWDRNPGLDKDTSDPAIFNEYPLPSSGVLIGVGERVEVRNGRFVIKRITYALARSMHDVGSCGLALAGDDSEASEESWLSERGNPPSARPGRTWLERDASIDISHIDVFTSTANDKRQPCRLGAADDVRSGLARSPSSRTCLNGMKAASWWV